MRSFTHKPSNRRQVYLALTGAIDNQLRETYAKKHEAGETLASLAGKLGINRSAVHRRLTGRHNMTIETLADMVWALGQCVKIDIFDPSGTPSNEHRIVPRHHPACEAGSTQLGPAVTFNQTPTEAHAKAPRNKLKEFSA